LKPAPFEYAAPRSLEEALALLAEHGADAKVLAGGQSLLPLLHRRRLRPRLLVDLNRIEGLDSLRSDGAALCVGALVRQSVAERSDLVRERAPLIADVLPRLGDVGIRNRGTVVGNLVYADWGAQPPAAAIALGATARAVSTRGEREIAAKDFFLGFRLVSLEPDELVTEIRFPAPAPRTGHAWVDVADRHGDLPIVGAAAIVTLGEEGSCTGAGLVFSGVSATPFDATGAARVLAGERPSPELFAAAGERASADADPVSDGRASAAYRHRLVGVLATRALALAAERAA
jgi:CO/xanthine dehydrogenase FAD-binding subunit